MQRSANSSGPIMYLIHDYELKILHIPISIIKYQVRYLFLDPFYTDDMALVTIYLCTVAQKTTVQFCFREYELHTRFMLKYKREKITRIHGLSDNFSILKFLYINDPRLVGKTKKLTTVPGQFQQTGFINEEKHPIM